MVFLFILFYLLHVLEFDLFSGRNATLENLDGMKTGRGFLFDGKSKNISNMSMSDIRGVTNILTRHYVDVYYSEMRDNCETIPRMWDMYMEKNNDILTVSLIFFL